MGLHTVKRHWVAAAHRDALRPDSKKKTKTPATMATDDHSITHQRATRCAGFPADADTDSRVSKHARPVDVLHRLDYD